MHYNFKALWQNKVTRQLQGNGFTVGFYDKQEGYMMEGCAGKDYLLLSVPRKKRVWFRGLWSMPQTCRAAKLGNDEISNGKFGMNYFAL